MTPDTAAHTGIAILAMVVKTIFGLAVDARAHRFTRARVVAAAAVGMMCARQRRFSIALVAGPGQALLDGAAWLSVPLLAVGAGVRRTRAAQGPASSSPPWPPQSWSVAVVMLTGRGTTAAAAVVSLCAMAWLAATVRACGGLFPANGWACSRSSNCSYSSRWHRLWHYGPLVFVHLISVRSLVAICSGAETGLPDSVAGGRRHR